MEFKPHDYQEYCIQYVKTHPIAALFLTMGLGKTAITLTAVNDLMLDTFDVSKVLVVAPLPFPSSLGTLRHGSGR